MTENALQLAMQQSSDCDCHSGLKARMSFNVIFDCRANYSLFFYFLIFKLLSSLVFFWSKIWINEKFCLILINKKH